MTNHHATTPVPPDRSDAGTRVESVTITPASDAWQRALESSHAQRSKHAEFRTQLGLPTDRPVVMSGHQAEFWHPGVVAKFFAMFSAAARYRAAPAWVIVDQDTNDPLTIRLPIRPASEGALAVRSWNIAGDPATDPAQGVPTAVRAAVLPASVPSALSLASPGAAQGAAAIHNAIAAHADKGNIALQTSLAAADLAAHAWSRATRLPSPPVTFFTATSVVQTQLAGALLDRMRADPALVRSTYNAAVERHPGAGVARLEGDQLPLWLFDNRPGAQRRPMRDADMRSPPNAPGPLLAPRALLLTGLLRLSGCDLFIHGMGGAGPTGEAGYDRITAEWLRDWLGDSIAPMALVTATVRLRFPDVPTIPSPETIAHAAWLAHAARHRPGLLNDQPSELRRTALIRELAALKGTRDTRSRSRRHEAYRELHRVLAASRDAHAATLQGLTRSAQTLAAYRTASQIINDRTWAFPLYEDDQLDELARRVHAQLG